MVWVLGLHGLSRVSFMEILNVMFSRSWLNLPRAQALTRQISTPLLSGVLTGLGGCLNVVLVSVQSMIRLCQVSHYGVFFIQVGHKESHVMLFSCRKCNWLTHLFLHH